MRTLMYKVVDDRGYEFTTASYTEATRKENHILCTYLIKDDEENEKVRAGRKLHAAKIMEKFGIKRG